MKEFNLYFTDLNEEAQALLLETVEAERMEEMNWDLFPIVILEFEDRDYDFTERI